MKRNPRLKGQGAIEYLLIIAAAILVVALVIIAITGALAGGETQSQSAMTAQVESMSALDIQHRIASGQIELTGNKIDAGEWEINKTYFITEDIIYNAGGVENDFFYDLGSADEGVTIDCTGHKITKTNASSTPPYSVQIIRVSNGKNITLKDCILENNSYSGRGILIMGSETENINLENITVVNSDFGLTLYDNLNDSGKGTITIKDSDFCSTSVHCALAYSSSVDIPNLTVENTKADTFYPVPRWGICSSTVQSQFDTC